MTTLIGVTGTDGKPVLHPGPGYGTTTHFPGGPTLVGVTGANGKPLAGPAPGYGTVTHFPTQWTGTPQAIPNPALHPAPAAPPPAPVVASPLDSTYFQALNNATLQANNKINGYNQQAGYARIDLQSNLDKLAHQQPIDTLNMQEKYNKSGLLYSGHLGQGLGELNRNYLDRQSGLQQNFERQQAARDAATSAIRSGLTLQQAALYAAAVDRASVKSQKDPTLSQSPASLVPPSPAPGAAGTAKAAGHSSKYTGAGTYTGGNVAFNPRALGLKAVGHSQNYNGPGKYVKVR